MSRRGNYPISLSWDYYDDSKRGALGLSIGKIWRWLLMLLLLLLLAALIIMGWQNNRDNDGDGNAAVPAAAPGAVTAVPNAAYEGWRWVVPGGATPDGWDRHRQLRSRHPRSLLRLVAGWAVWPGGGGHWNWRRHLVRAQRRSCDSRLDLSDGRDAPPTALTAQGQVSIDPSCPASTIFAGALPQQNRYPKQVAASNMMLPESRIYVMIIV